MRVGRKWYSLRVFIDLFSRIVVGWDLSDSLEKHSTIKAPNKAILRRNHGKSLLIHINRWIQYARADLGSI